MRRLGTYRVRAAGLTSRAWRIGSKPLIFRLLAFFRTNRDGNESAIIHGPAHLNDAVVDGGPHDGQHIDMTGGWMDAGDMIHFTQTTAYSAALLQAAGRLAPGFADAVNQEAFVGVRWLLKAHPFPDLFVTQVGGAVDHTRGFRNPSEDDTSGVPGIATRSAYHWSTGVGGDIAGKVAVALALAATNPVNAPFRDEDLAAAREWYAAGKAAGRATPKLPGTGGFYVFRAWKGSMAAGAAALYRATGDQSYLADALAYLRSSGERYRLLEGSSMAPFAAADICGALGAPPLGGVPARKLACDFIRDGASSTLDYARQNAFAPASYFQWGTTGVNAAGGAQAALAALGAGFKPGFRIAAGARDFMLGRNAWGASFVAGFGPRSPKKIHSWASVFEPHDGLPPGALVGGPAPIGQIRGQGFRPDGPLRAFNSDLAYEDRRADYVTSEPAIDYSATAILLFAALRAR